MKKLLNVTLALILSLNLFAQEGYKPGDVAKDFRLKNIDGKFVTLADYSKSKGVIVVFTCNHCPYAKAYEDRIIELDKKFASQGFPVIAINPNDPTEYPEDSYENMQKRAKEKNYTFPYLVDQTQNVAKTYGATKTPHVYLLKNDGGTYKVEYIGAIDDNSQDASGVKEKYLENAISQVMKNEKVTVNYTKALGCSIKWKKA